MLEDIPDRTPFIPESASRTVPDGDCPLDSLSAAGIKPQGIIVSADFSRSGPEFLRNGPDTYAEGRFSRAFYGMTSQHTVLVS